MKKKLLIAILTLVAMACLFGLSACGENTNHKPTTHVHNYQWVDNGDGTHKQHCSVADCDEPDVNSGEHDFTNGDCVCGKTNSGNLHTHVWAQTWEHDETNHWKDCTDSACTEKDEYASHDFANGECICGKKKECTISFDCDGGSTVQPQKVEYNGKVIKPESPSNTGFYFEGWYVGNEKYDFSSPVTNNLTLKAKWSAVTEIDSAFTAALSSDYSNFMSDSMFSDESGSYTDTFMQTANTVYWRSGSTLFNDHIVIFDDDGRMLAMYYLDGNDWKKSGLVDYADFVVPLYLNEISLADVEYGEGVYNVKPESLSSVIYALFRSNDAYSEFYIKVENEHICEVGGKLADMAHVQTFYDFGNTEVVLPTLPVATVSISTKNKEVEAGTPIDKNELISFLFDVRVENKVYAVTDDMLDFGNLVLDNPQAGTYTVTVSFDTWDGETHSATATVTVTIPQTEETFAQIFAKDYTNLTISGSFNGKFANGIYFGANAYYYIENDGTLTKYHATTFAETTNAWVVLPRMEMLFELEYMIFQETENSSVYEAKNIDVIKPILEKSMTLKTNVFDASKDFSISLTVSLGRITGISYSYYYKVTASASTSSLKTLNYTLSDFGTTEFTVPDEITAKRNPTTSTQMDVIDDKHYVV